MLRQAKEQHIPEYSSAAYQSYIAHLQETLKAKKHVDFTNDSFQSAVDGTVVRFPKYIRTNNPFVRLLHSNYVIGAQPTFDKPSPKAKAKTKPKTEEESIKHKMPKAVFEALMANMPFKTSNECKSSARSKGYYISKGDLVDYIKKNKDIEKYFPKNYKTLSKDALCDVVFT